MAGIHQAKVLHDRETYEHMEAEEYGNASRIVIGKLSGKGGVESRISGVAMNVDRTTLIAVTKAAKIMSGEEGRDIVDNDIERIVAQEQGELLVDSFELSRMHVESDTKDGQSWSFVRIEMVDRRPVSGVPAQLTSTAESEKGTIDAAVQAINAAIYFDGTMQWDEGDASDIGSDASAGVFVTVTQGETAFKVYAQANSIDDAVIQAYVDGINLIERTRSRQRATDAELAQT
jgi:hypothetical protein